VSGQSSQPHPTTDGEPQGDVTGEHRWPPAIAILVATALYLFLPSDILAVQRYIIAGIVLLLLIPLIVLNPRRMTKETRWSRIAELAIGLVILVANQASLVQVIVLLLHRSNHGDTLLLAALQVFITNVIAFALVFWSIDRGGPVSRTAVPRADLPLADFRFPQDEDRDNVKEVSAGSSIDSGWLPNFLDYAYFSLTNSMAFSPTDTMPLTHRVKALMAFESFAGFVLLALVIARAVSLIG
jgi:uncharacterized membrane protein